MCELRLSGIPTLGIGLAFDAIPFVRAAGPIAAGRDARRVRNMIRILRHVFSKPVAEPAVALSRAS
jgi:hypothetical protein